MLFSPIQGAARIVLVRFDALPGQVHFSVIGDLLNVRCWFGFRAFDA